MTSDSRTRYASIALIDASDLCEVLAISRHTLDEWTSRGLFPRPFSMTPGSPKTWRVIDIATHIEKAKRSRRRKQKPRGAVRKHIERKAKRAAQAAKGGAE